jgi:hypothetical protein
VALSKPDQLVPAWRQYTTIQKRQQEQLPEHLRVHVVLYHPKLSFEQVLNMDFKSQSHPLKNCDTGSISDSVDRETKSWFANVRKNPCILLRDNRMWKAAEVAADTIGSVRWPVIDWRSPIRNDQS